MATEIYLKQLENKYPTYLKSIISNEFVFPIELRGGKDKPTTFSGISDVTRSFKQFEKTGDKFGWTIEWGKWNHKTFGFQDWPIKITVETEDDLLFLLKKEKEVLRFKQILQQLLEWNPAIQVWLVANYTKILALELSWKGICDVVDYFLQNDVSNYYLRSLPVPVHTKFIGLHESTILSMLKHLSPERFPFEVKSLEEALGLKSKQYLFTVRWLDINLAKSYNIDLEVMGITLSGLQQLDNNVKEIWLVENETNLYLVPNRKNALIIFSRGYAVNLLKSIPLFENVKLFYWGDLDIDGFNILHDFKKMYNHVKSVLMDIETVEYHQAEKIKIEPLSKNRILPLLNENELKAFEHLAENKWRIEQEKLNQHYIHQYIQRLNDTN
ncbi:MAG: hypothetical protein K9I82_13465 [Chitinophagaceae bacterium]|nr:hypothetical protein [Chitinophagaceae bacterium]